MTTLTLAYRLNAALAAGMASFAATAPKPAYTPENASEFAHRLDQSEASSKAAAGTFGDLLQRLDASDSATAATGYLFRTLSERVSRLEGTPASDLPAGRPVPSEADPVRAARLAGPPTGTDTGPLVPDWMARRVAELTADAPQIAASEPTPDVAAWAARRGAAFGAMAAAAAPFALAVAAVPFDGSGMEEPGSIVP